MTRFDNWSQEDLAWKCRELSDEVEQLEKELSERKDEICGLHLRIETELEPRLRMDKLKPCPFCGCRNPITKVRIINSDTLQFSVTCNECGATIQDNYDLYAIGFDTINAAIRNNIASWNRRVKNATD